MFQGETAISIDDKGRLAIPTAFRDLVAGACGNRLVLTYNPYEAGCLWLYPESVWQSVRDQVNALPNAKKVHRNLQLKLVGAATVLEALADPKAPRQPAPAALMLADVVIHASTDAEAFGRTVIEAQAMARPVIASDLGAPAKQWPRA
jgi:glycosyltransferase involved in cell wall biosynthesis